MLQTIDIQQQLIKERNKRYKAVDVLKWVQEVFDDIDATQKSVLERLSQSPIQKTINSFNINEVDTDAIFHVSEIKKICINYRLRFLDTRYFKSDYPKEVISKIKVLEENHATTLDGFKIIAPSKLFELNEADDPLLFAPMGNGYYYLIHKWGKDLHPLRKLKYWSVKNVENLGVAIFAISFLLTIITKDFFFNDEANFGYLFMLFLFYVKGVMGMIFFLGASSGKNFSEYCWLSKYNKIS
ncbi:hypothetical protein DUT90_06785 [Polaribacter sp. WD7]|uniref:hypothetical protein n=1 Tax=Polaribacter sp. WD7 TaxID=2269061 RepID=UPI000DF2AAE5|nr:hypothetical protein [Polaribacter sp. WD7]RCS27265.1 hypothetical protein DUT90_06785 [Polaribacter sp. WD7]